MSVTRFLAPLAALALAAAPALAQPALTDSHRPAADTARDAMRKPAALLAFAGVRPGQTIVEFIPGHGYFTRLFAVAVKPGGRVIAVVPAAAAQHDGEGARIIGTIAADPAYGDVSVVERLATPEMMNADIVFTAQNYHDLHNALPPEGVAAFNASVFKALKPGGVYIVVDHAATAGSGLTATSALHRIDPALVKGEVMAAGFAFDGESAALANPADGHDKIVFDPAVRGHTDQFAYRFRKPR